MRFVDDHERAKPRAFARYLWRRMLREGITVLAVMTGEAMHRMHTYVSQMSVRDGGTPHGLQGGWCDDVHLLVRLGDSECRVRFPQSHVVGEKCAVMFAHRDVDAGDGVALVRQQRDITEFGGGRRWDDGAGKPSLHVAGVVDGPRHGVYQSSNGVRWRSGTS